VTEYLRDPFDRCVVATAVCFGHENLHKGWSGWYSDEHLRTLLAPETALEAFGVPRFFAEVAARRLRAGEPGPPMHSGGFGLHGRRLTRQEQRRRRRWQAAPSWVLEQHTSFGTGTYDQPDTTVVARLLGDGTVHARGATVNTATASVPHSWLGAAGELTAATVMARLPAAPNAEQWLFG
jgi:hypothetical protein